MKSGWVKENPRWKLARGCVSLPWFHTLLTFKFDGVLVAGHGLVTFAQHATAEADCATVGLLQDTLFGKKVADDVRNAIGLDGYWMQD